MSNKVLLILIGLVLVLVLVMGGGMFMIWAKLPAASPKAAVPETEAEANPDKAKPEDIGAVVSVDTFIVNLPTPAEPLSAGHHGLRAGQQAGQSVAKTAGEELARRIPGQDTLLILSPTVCRHQLRKARTS
jgi:hypothetical protein